MWVASERKPERHLVLYDPAEERHLNHLVAHEIGHILQFADTSPQHRLVPVVSRANVRKATVELDDELRRIARLGAPSPVVRESVRAWVRSVVSRLSDVPTDTLIEHWIWDNHQSLRGSQRASLEAQAVDLHRALGREVEAFTPRRVLDAANAINYARIKPVASFLNEPWMMRPYRDTRHERLGEDLLKLFCEHQPRDLDGCRAVSRAWAERLGVSRWFSWRRLDEIPPDAASVQQ